MADVYGRLYNGSSWIKEGFNILLFFRKINTPYYEDELIGAIYMIIGIDVLIMAKWAVKVTMIRISNILMKELFSSEGEEA